MIQVISLVKQHGHERLRAAIEGALTLGCSDVGELSRFERPLPAMTDYDRLLERGQEVAS